MANKLYPKFKEALGNAQVNLLTDDIRAIVIDAADYTYSASHEFLSSVPSGARVAISGSLTGKSFTNGVFDADDVTFPSVTGDQSEVLMLYKHTGSDATARLIAYLDTGYTGLPVTPDGTDVNIQWPNDGNKIFAL